jgi:predicted aspartyl protease
MLQGAIDALGQIRVPIELIAADGTGSTLEALLDTGFTGSLAIREQLVRTLGWQPHGYVEASLASGSAALGLFIGEVVFDGRRQLVRAVTITSDDVIVGLSLLRGKRLLADFRTGVVTIECTQYVPGLPGGQVSLVNAPEGIRHCAGTDERIPQTPY